MIKILWMFLVLGCILFLVLGRNVIKEAFKSGKNEIDAVANELKEINNKQENKDNE